MLNRRNFMVASSAATLGGCVSCKFPDSLPVSRPISDAHAHFFNGADLPVHNFVRYVIVPAYAPNLPEVVLALADMALWIAKRLSVSASSEIKHLRSGELLGRDEVREEEFGRTAAKRQEQVINEAGSKTFAERKPIESLADSYFYLATLLGAFDIGTRRALDDGKVRIDPQVYEDIARQGRDASQRTLPDSLDLPEAMVTYAAQSSVDVKAIIKWVFVMCQSRCSHVRRYLNTIPSGGSQVTHVTNLLVDYDRWLGDRPLGNSTHAQQVEFWTAYAARTESIPGWPRLHTFAGFDPLKDAGERLSSGKGTTFETMKEWYGAGREPGSNATHKIAGFKVYPPMGFQPDKNAEPVLPTNEPPKQRAEIEVQRWWSDNGWPLDKLGTSLDESLDLFFEFCAEQDVPIMAHASPSNDAMSNSARKALISNWVPRVEQTFTKFGRPLRLCLGHFGYYVYDLSAFKDLMKLNVEQVGGEPKARVYFDLSYDVDILEDNQGVLRYFLNALERVCKDVGDEGNYLTFGSDWIMLGQQPGAGRYLDNFKRALDASEFWRKNADKVLRTNFLDFMQVPH